MICASLWPSKRQKGQKFWCEHDQLWEVLPCLSNLHKRSRQMMGRAAVRRLESSRRARRSAQSLAPEGTKCLEVLGGDARPCRGQIGPAVESPNSGQHIVDNNCPSAGGGKPRNQPTIVHLTYEVLVFSNA